MKKVQFSVGKDKLIGHLFTPKVIRKKHKSVLIVHGWTSNQNRGFHLARALVKKGYIVMTFDMRGHGVSDRKLEDLSRKDFLNDVVSAYDFLARSTGVDQNNIIAIGSSFGGYMVTLLSAKRKIKALVMRVPANYKDEGFTHQYKITQKKKASEAWKNKLHKNTATKSLRALHVFKGNVLIVESGKDELVPSGMVQSYVKAVTSKKKLTYKIMESATHSISQHPTFQRQFRDLVLNWLK